MTTTSHSTMARRRSELWPTWGAFGWGLSEAVVFFIIPDVLLTWIAVRLGTRKALAACLWAVGGAVVGGLIAHLWGSLDPQSAQSFMALLPGIDTSMIDSVNLAVSTDGPRSLLEAPLRGEPYKLYAGAAGMAGSSPFELAMWTVPGRLWRFVALSGLFGLIRTGLNRAMGRPPERALIMIWAAFWLIVYAVFWSR